MLSGSGSGLVLFSVTVSFVEALVSEFFFGGGGVELAGVDASFLTGGFIAGGCLLTGFSLLAGGRLVNGRCAGGCCGATISSGGWGGSVLTRPFCWRLPDERLAGAGRLRCSLVSGLR